MLQVPTILCHTYHKVLFTDDERFMNYTECPIVRTLEVMGGKWKPIILHYLSESPRRSGELGRLIPQASGKMLTQQLRELEADKIIRRKIYRQVPPKVEYILTPLGESLRPVMIAMCAWGETYARRENVEESQDRAYHSEAGIALGRMPSDRSIYSDR
jgi:DNA-binding HxlR family transcriptional regulator